MRCRCHFPLKMVCFVENSISFNQLNISDIPCALKNDIEEAVRLTQPITLYVSVHITTPNLYNRPPSLPIEDNDPPAEEATIPGHIQFPAPGHHSPLSHHRPVAIGNSVPQSREDPIDRSDMWERAVGRIKWVMDTLSPIAEVRTMPF